MSKNLGLQKSAKESRPYWNATLAGLALGIVLFSAFLLTGKGLGASGGMHRLVITFQGVFMHEHLLETIYTSKMAAQPVWNNWLVLEIIGVILGGAISGLLRGRMRVETRRGPQITNKTRWILAFAGGALMGFGARFARGCTSGQALSGGALLSAGSWVFMFTLFIVAFLLARPFSRTWN